MVRVVMLSEGNGRLPLWKVLGAFDEEGEVRGIGRMVEKVVRDRCKKKRGRR